MTWIEARSANIECVCTSFDTEAAGQRTRDATVSSLNIPEEVRAENGGVQRGAVETDSKKAQIATGGSGGKIADRYDLKYSIGCALKAWIQGLAVAAPDCQDESWECESSHGAPPTSSWRLIAIRERLAGTCA
jgi:hypothetical protein